MRESGIITSLQGETASVQIHRGEKCHDCKGCIWIGEDTMQMEARNDIGAGEGDRVEVEVEPAKVVGGSILLFVFPLLMMIFGYVIAVHLLGSGEGLGIVAAFAGFALAFVLIRVLDNGHSSQPPRIVRVIGGTEMANMKLQNPDFP